MLLQKSLYKFHLSKKLLTVTLKINSCTSLNPVLPFKSIGDPLHSNIISRTMANSKFSYVRSFESEKRLAPEQWIVISLKQVSDKYSNKFLKSNDIRDNYSQLIIHSSNDVMNQFRELRLAYISFDKVDFVIGKNSMLHQRRRYKLLTYLVSCMTASYVRLWPKFFEDINMDELPLFDAKIYLLPNDQLLRDILTMHQMNHHLDNLKYTLMLAINNSQKHADASICSNDCEDEVITVDAVDDSKSKFTGLPGEETSSIPKLTQIPTNEKEAYYNEALFAQFDINYNSEPEVHKKGKVLLRRRTSLVVTNASGNSTNRHISKICEDVVNFKQDDFWLPDNRVVDDITKLNIKFASIPKFLVDEKLLPHSWPVVRIDGKTFHKFSTVHGFKKPNDRSAIDLMNIAACDVMKIMTDINISFGESDEFSFVFDRYKRYTLADLRHSSILLSRCVSIFTASYVANWDKVFNSEVELNLLDLNTEFDVCNYKDSTSQDALEEGEEKVDYPMEENEKIEFSGMPTEHQNGSIDHSEKERKNFDNEVISNPSSNKNSSLINITTLPPLDTKDMVKELIKDEKSLHYSPIFDGRVVLYPTNTNVRDYLSWRQVDCHINNMYNTVFWKLIQITGCSNKEAEKILNGTFSQDKRKILLDLGIDYDLEPVIHRKGSVIFRKKPITRSKVSTKSVKVTDNPKLLKKTNYIRNANGQLQKKPSEGKLWWNADCVAAKVDKLKMLTLCNQNPSAENSRELKRYEAVAKKVFKEAKKKYNFQKTEIQNQVMLTSSESSRQQSLNTDQATIVKPIFTILQRPKNENISSQDCEKDFSNGNVSLTNILVGDSKTSSFKPDEITESHKPSANPLDDLNPWWDDECRQAKVRRNLAKKNMRKVPSEVNIEQLKACHIQMYSAIKRAKKKFLNTQQMSVVTENEKSCLETFEQRVVTTCMENGNTLADLDDKSSVKLDAAPLQTVDELWQLSFPITSTTGITSKVVKSSEENHENNISGDTTSVTDLNMESGQAPSASKLFNPLNGEVNIDSGYMSNISDDRSIKEETTVSSNVRSSSEETAVEADADNVPRVVDDEQYNDDGYKVMSGNIVLCHSDIIGDQFWLQHPYIIGEEKSVLVFKDL